MSSLDTMLPVVGLLAILFARTLTTMSEGHRLAEAGFTPAEIEDGMARVMAERVTRREELRAHAPTRRRRRLTIRWGAVMLVAAIVMIRLALATRVQIGPTQYQTPAFGVFLVFSGFAWLGMSLVLLLKSPFRMSPAERLFRLVWLGPIGRGFVRLSARAVKKSGDPMQTRVGAAPVRRLDASARTAPAPRVEQLRPTLQTGALPSTNARDPLAGIEARVKELERWRRSRGD